MINKIDIGAEISRGWTVFKENMALLIPVALIAGLLGGLTCGILAGPMMAGVYLIIRRLLQNDPVKPQIGDVFKGFEYFVDTLLCVIAIAIIIGILSFIPVVGQVVGFVGGAFSVTGVMFVALGKMKFADALKKIGQEVSTGPFWMFILTLVIAQLISGVGVIACVIGVFFTMPIGMCIAVCAYSTAFGDDPQALAQPPESAPPPPAQ